MFNAERAQYEFDGVGAAGAADAARRGAKGGEILLEPAHLLAENIPSGTEDGGDPGLNLILQTFIPAPGAALGNHRRPPD